MPDQSACAADLLLEHLRSLGVSIELPRDLVEIEVMSQHQHRSSWMANDTPAGFDDALVLAVIVDALEGPGAAGVHWRSWT